ncbi:MAG: hypothetical protein ACR2IK_14545, partial [Chloroflexota bacterium]
GVSSDAHSLQFNYSSGTPGPVTLQLFNYTPNTVTFNLSDSGMVSTTSAGSVTTPLTLQLGSAPAPAAPSAAPAASAPAAPAAANPSGAPSTIASCQYASDNTHPLPFCSTGQTAAVPVASNAIVTYKFNYPGDNSNVTFTSSLTPSDPTTLSAEGFNVFDTTSKAVPPPPVEVVTIATNGVSTDPHSLQFNYSSGTPGPVTIQLFNYTGTTVTFNLSDSGMVTNASSGSVTTPITLQLS